MVCMERRGNNNCFFSASDQSVVELGCCGTFGYSRELGGHLADTHTHWVQHCVPPTSISCNMIYSLFSPPTAFFRPLVCLVKLFGKKSDLCKKETELLQLKGTYGGGVRAGQPFGEWPFPPIQDANQTKGRILFYLFSYLCFFIKGLRRQCTQCWDVIKA